jgi:hypothetical protein
MVNVRAAATSGRIPLGIRTHVSRKKGTRVGALVFEIVVAVSYCAFPSDFFATGAATFLLAFFVVFLLAAFFTVLVSLPFSGATTAAAGAVFGATGVTGVAGVAGAPWAKAEPANAIANAVARITVLNFFMAFVLLVLG